jgi:archaellum component FlaC
VVESLAAAGVISIVATLWRLSVEHAGMRVTLEKGMNQVVDQIKSLRNEISRDVERLEDVIEDHETRIRKLEKDQ